MFHRLLQKIQFAVLDEFEEAMAKFYIHQIYYDDASRAALEPGFIPLDNTSNERPDWFEYHPIRKFLLNHSLEHDSYYGFFSPSFAGKTKLSAAKVIDFIRANESADVVLFCPFFTDSALFLNVFEQGERSHPGLMRISQEFIDAIGMNVDLKTLVTDSTNTVFSNYFVARAKFWKKWFHVAEQLYKRAEDASQSEASSSLVSDTRHMNIQTQALQKVHHKVFVMERLATLLLSTSDAYKVAFYDSLALPIYSVHLPILHHAVACDALKIAYQRLKNGKYLDEFNSVRINAFEIEMARMAGRKGSEK
jgi:hypothetical protein